MMVRLESFTVRRIYPSVRRFYALSPVPGTSPRNPPPLLLRTVHRGARGGIQIFRGTVHGIIEKFLFVALCWPLGTRPRLHRRAGYAAAAAAFRGISAVKRKEKKRRRDTLTARRTTVVPLPHQSSVMMQSRMERSGEHRAP